jgi:hypothetical protein
MSKPTTDKNIVREQLKTKRNLLFDQYCKDPQNTRLAVEIKLIDDQLADLTWNLPRRQSRNSARLTS